MNGGSGVQVQQSEHIQLVTRLEQWLMEGAYNKVLDARSHVPDQAYSYFMEKLLSTVRSALALLLLRSTTVLEPVQQVVKAAKEASALFSRALRLLL